MQITTIGLDLAKSVFQVHGVDEAGRVTVAKALGLTISESFLLRADQLIE